MKMSFVAALLLAAAAASPSCSGTQPSSDTARQPLREKTSVDLGDSSSYSLVPPLGSVENGLLKFDTKASDSTWNTCFKTTPGLFKPGKSYSVSLTCKTQEALNDSYLFLLVRAFDANHGNSDLASRPVFQFEGETHVKLKFSVPEGYSNYALQIHTKKKASGYVKDIIVEEETDKTFIPADGGQKASINPETLPKGALEFTVDQPKLKPGSEISVASFGASPDVEDNLKAFNDAITKCAAESISRLAVPKGIYHFTSDKSISFENLKDFEFDGQGSTFIFLKKQSAMLEVKGCERTLFKNFNIDWDWDKDPLASVVKVEDVGPDGQWADFRFVDYEKFPRPDTRIAMIDMLDPATMSVGCEGGFNLSFEFFKGTNAPKHEWLSGNLLRIFPGNAKLKVGQLFRMPHYYYDMNGVVMSGNTHLTIQDVNIYSCPGFGFVGGGEQHHVQLIRTNIARPPGSSRPITCTADHLHFGNSQGFFKMESCEFSLGNDDCINIHDNSTFALKSSESSVRTQGMRSMLSYHENDPIELRNADYSPSGFKAKLKSIKPIDKAQGIYEMQFDEPVPGALGTGFVVFNWRFDSHNLIIRNCFFHDNRARGLLLLARDVTVENCRFLRNQMGAIKVETGYTLDSWREGYGASDIVIRGNSFEKINPMGSYSNELRPDIYISTYLKCDPSTEKASYPILHDILIEDNKFIETTGAAAFICSARNVIFRNNLIENKHPNLKEYSYRGAIGAAYSSNVFVTGNRWIGSEFNVKPGLLFDAETAKDVYCWDNKVEE